MTKELTVFSKLGLVPYISSVLIEKHTQSKVSANLQIDVPFSRGVNPWILDDKILKLLNVTVTISTNSRLTELLNSSKKDWKYSGISDSSFIRGIDYYQSIKKLQPAYLNFKIETNAKDNSKIIHTGFVEDAIFSKTNLEHLTIFVAVGIDTKEAASRFKINPAKYKEISGYCTEENLIENSVYINKKISDISVIQNISQFNFSNTKFIKELNSLDLKVQEKVSKTNFSSELFYSIDKTSKVIGFFITDILELFSKESKLSIFFDKEEFRKMFFSKEEHFLPKRVKVIRYDEYSNETLLYDGIYSSLIDTEQITLTKIQVTNSKKLYTSFKDKTSGELTRYYRYRVLFEFRDVSISYLEKILEKIDQFSLDINKIVNIAKSGKNFDSITNSFNSRFYSMLERDNLSIKTTIKSVYSVLSQFVEMSKEDKLNMINLSNSKYYNFEIIEQIHSILTFLQSQISTLKTALSKINTLNIVVDNFFETIVDKTVCLNFKEEIVQANETVEYPSITKSTFLKRVSAEIQKYYNVPDVSHNSKFSYFSPSFFGNREFSIPQSFIDYSTLKNYNNALIDIYYKKVSKG